MATSAVPPSMASVTCGASNINVKVGTVVLLPRKFIGTVKWIGNLGEDKEGVFLGIKLSEGSGDCDGTFNNVKYFHAPNNKALFCPKDEVKQTISGEELLQRLVQSHKRVKAQRSEISSLQDQITNTPEKTQQAQAAIASMANPEVKADDDKDITIQRYLEKEVEKNWWTSERDCCARYPNRSPADIKKLYDPKRDNFDNMDPSEGHSRIVYTVATSNRDNLIASGSDDKTVSLWRLASAGDNPTLRCVHKIKLRSCINSLSFSPDGSLLGAALDSGWIELYDMATGKNIGSIEGQTTSEVWTICFSPDGKQVISGALDRAVRIWDVQTRHCNWALRGHDEWVNGVAVSPDGRHIVSAGGDKTVRVWDTNTMSCSSTLRGHTDFVRSVCVLEDNSTIVSASDDCTLRTWTMQGNGIDVLKGHGKGIYSVSAGKDSYVASASRDNSVKLWNVSRGENALQHSFCSHNGDVNSCSFVDNANYLVSGSDDKTVHVYPVSYN